MEEKNINFNLIHMQDDIIKVSDDTNDDLDNLETDEMIAIILTVMSKLALKHLDNIDEDFDEEDEDYQNDMNELLSLRDELIKGLINIINQVYANKTKTTLMLSEFSMAIYDKMLDLKTGHIYNKLVSTTHSSDIYVLEPLQALEGFLIDIITELYNNDVPKKEIKQVIIEWLDVLKKSCDNIIDEF